MPFAVLPDDCSQSSVFYKAPFVCFVIRNSSLLLIKSQKYASPAVSNAFG